MSEIWILRKPWRSAQREWRGAFVACYNLIHEKGEVQDSTQQDCRVLRADFRPDSDVDVLVRIVSAVEPFEFDRIHGGGRDYLVLDARSAVRRPAERYVKAING